MTDEDPDDRALQAAPEDGRRDLLAASALRGPHRRGHGRRRRRLCHPRRAALPVRHGRQPDDPPAGAPHRATAAGRSGDRHAGGRAEALRMRSWTMTTPRRGPQVAIIGAGFTGSLLAVHLLDLAPDATVLLFDGSGQFGRGLAYATANADHLLNVRTANMSALPDKP